MEILPKGDYSIGQNVTELLGVRKWEMEEKATSSGTIIGPLPGGVPKTEETRIQSEPGLLQEFAGLPYAVTTKIVAFEPVVSALAEQDGDMLPFKLPKRILGSLQKRNSQFEYDPSKSESNKEKHGIDLEEAQALWDGPVLEVKLAYEAEDRFACVCALCACSRCVRLSPSCSPSVLLLAMPLPHAASTTQHAVYRASRLAVVPLDSSHIFPTVRNRVVSGGPRQMALWSFDFVIWPRILLR